MLGELKGQGLKVTSKSLWDIEHDNHASYTYRNVNNNLVVLIFKETLFCVAMIFGTYFE